VPPDVSQVMTDTAAATFEDAFDDDGLLEDAVFSEDEEAALLVALLRWRAPDLGPEAT